MKFPPRVSAADVNRWFGLSDLPQAAGTLPSVFSYLRANCAERYMVTLTDRRRLTSDQLTHDIGWTLHQANRALFGTAYKRHRKVSLATYVVHERTLNDGLHAHLIVGVPNGSLELKSFRRDVSVPELILQLWQNSGRAYRRAEGQDWRPVHDLRGAFGYLDKTVRAHTNIDPIDLVNTTFPKAYAVRSAESE